MVNGTATLGGASVQIAIGSTIATGHQYTILTDTGGGIGGGNIFSPTVIYGIYRGTLSYDADDVFITFGLNSLLPLLPPGVPANGVNVANAIDNFLAGGGTPPAGFQNLFNLSPTQLQNDLSQLAGQNAAGAQTSAFTLMTEFVDLMLGQSGGAGGNGGGLGFAPDQQTAALPSEIALAYDSILKAPPKPQSFDQRWSVWGSGFGGTATFNGNAAVGSNTVTASTYGSAAGMEYRADPNTVYGFALAGSGLNWSVAQNLGTGRSDSFQAGVYVKTDWGPAYVSGAFAVGNNWFTTNRIAVGDQLTASFTGQSYALRGEAGYRYTVPVANALIGVTPYGALQTQWFHTPTYSETDLTGGGLGLTYASATCQRHAQRTRRALRRSHHLEQQAADAARVARVGARLGQRDRPQCRVPGAARLELHRQRRLAAAGLGAHQRERAIFLHGGPVVHRQVRRRVRAGRADLRRIGDDQIYVVSFPCPGWASDVAFWPLASLDAAQRFSRSQD